LRLVDDLEVMTVKVKGMFPGVPVEDDDLNLVHVVQHVGVGIRTID